MEILTCENVVKAYGRGETRVEALRGVSLRVERGAFAARRAVSIDLASALREEV